MVSSQLPGLTKTSMHKPLQTQLFFPVNLPDDAVSDSLELDFSDLFGPVPAQASPEVSCGDLVNAVSAAADASEIIYEDPVVICNRSHSLVGTSKLILRDTGCGGTT